MQSGVTGINLHFCSKGMDQDPEFRMDKKHNNLIILTKFIHNAELNGAYIQIVDLKTSAFARDKIWGIRKSKEFKA